MGGGRLQNEDKLQVRLHIFPVKGVHWALTCTYTTIDMNNTVDVDKIKHLFMLLVLPTELVFKH